MRHTHCHGSFGKECVVWNQLDLIALFEIFLLAVKILCSTLSGATYSHPRPLPCWACWLWATFTLLSWPQRETLALRVDPLSCWEPFRDYKGHSRVPFALRYNHLLCKGSGQSQPASFPECPGLVSLAHLLWAFFHCKGLLISHSLSSFSWVWQAV